MSFRSIDGFTAAPLPVVDYEAELQRLDDQVTATQPVDTESGESSGEETRRGLIRLADFMQQYGDDGTSEQAENSGARQPDLSGSAPVVRQALRAYLKVRDFKETASTRGHVCDILA